MREYLFRARSVTSGEWVYGSLLIDNRQNAYGPQIMWYEEGAGFVSADVELDSIGEYTGLHDKNGKRVFEGDIVKIHQFLFDGNEYEHETKGAIKWGEYGWLLSQIEGEAVNKYMGYKNGEGETYFINFYGLHEESFEVIGNIHEVSP